MSKTRPDEIKAVQSSENKVQKSDERVTRGFPPRVSEPSTAVENETEGEE